MRRVGAPGRVHHRCGAGAADIGTCRRANSCAGNRTACLPPQATHGKLLTFPAGVFEAIPELEFDQTLNLVAEAGPDLWTHPAGGDAESIPELEFDQTSGL